MEMEKRKRTGDGEEADGKRGKAWGDKEDDAVKEAAVPGDEEVDEFFAILRRIQVAVKYFQNRKDDHELTAPPWRPSFKREDFEGDTKTPAKLEGNQDAGLDLNSDPSISDEPDLSDSV